MPEMVNHLNLIFDNAKLYNIEGSEIFHVSFLCVIDIHMYLIAQLQKADLLQRYVASVWRQIESGGEVKMTVGLIYQRVARAPEPGFGIHLASEKKKL